MYFNQILKKGAVDLLKFIFHIMAQVASWNSAGVINMTNSWRQLLQVPEQKLRKTKETRDRKQNNSKCILIPSDQKHNAFRYLQKDPSLHIFFKTSRVFVTKFCFYIMNKYNNTGAVPKHAPDANLFKPFWDFWQKLLRRTWNKK